MALLDVSESGYLPANSSYTAAPTSQLPSLAYQQLAVGASAVQSAAFTSGTRLVRLHSDVACRVVVGANPTSTLATGFRLAPGTTEYFRVTPGNMLSVIAAS